MLDHHVPDIPVALPPIAGAASRDETTRDISCRAIDLWVRSMVMAADRRPTVVVISGVNGTGKSTLAARLRAIFDTPDTMLVSEWVNEGRSVVIEGVLAADFRQQVIKEAGTAGARVIVVECTCSDEDTHRDRVDRRLQSGASTITWEHTLGKRSSYRPHPSPDYVADAALPGDVHVSALVALLEA